jgi:hypothetical protein
MPSRACLPTLPHCESTESRYFDDLAATKFARDELEEVRDGTCYFIRTTTC